MIDLEALPPTVTVPDAAEILGCSTSAAYEAIRAGDFPVPVLRIGRAIRVPSRPLLEALGLVATDDGIDHGPDLHVITGGGA